MNKILFVNSSKLWGGGEKWHFEIAHTFKQKGYGVSLLASSGSELYNRSIIAGIPTHPVKISNLNFLNPFRILKLYRLIKSINPHIIILNFSADIKSAGIAAKIAGIRHIIYRRGNSKPIRNTLFNRFLFKRVINQILTNSEETKKSILLNNATLFPEEKIRIIYNGIVLHEIDDYKPNAIYSRRENEIILGSAGRLSHEKGHHFLIELAAMLKSTISGFKILIAGEGPDKEVLENQILEKGLQNYVSLLGFVQNISDFMHSIDIFILPSLWEGFGYVTIEAMACEKPAIAFNVGSNPEIICDEVTGLLVEPYDIAELAAKTERLITNPDQRIILGKAARKRVEDFFDQNRTVKELETYFNTLN